MAIIFDCPCSPCQSDPRRLARLLASIDPPLDGGPAQPFDGWAISLAIKAGHLKEDRYVGCKIAWKRTGDTFETLTLSPSLDYSPSSDWHGFIRDGNIQ